MTTPRHPDDYYATDPHAIRPLFEFFDWTNGGLTIWENSCGGGSLSTPMVAYGHNVLSTDLVYRGYGIGGIDFLKPSIIETFKFDAIVMNPPYKHHLEFLKKSLRIAPIVCTFAPLTFLAGGDKCGRYEFYQSTPPTQVLIFSDRPRYAKDGDFEKHKNGKTDFCWLIWIEGQPPQPPAWIRL